MKIYYCPETNVIGLGDGLHIEFYWNGKLEESYLPLFLQEGYWIEIGDV